jgi:hypothetical protein
MGPLFVGGSTVVFLALTWSNFRFGPHRLEVDRPTACLSQSTELSLHQMACDDNQLGKKQDQKMVLMVVMIL